MKRISVVLAVILAIVVLATPAYASNSIKFNEADGTVSIDYQASDYSDIKVLIQKGSEKYVYNVFDSSSKFPLQMGDGNYKVSICKRTSGKKYKVIQSASKNVKIDELALYKTSVQNIAWDLNSKSTKLAAELSLEKLSKEEQFEAVYGYVVEQISYDILKAQKLRTATRYLPSNDSTLQDKKGICYDYSSLTASMLRSLDIPTKLVEGKSSYTSDYHAWNEVYLNNKWQIIDTTIDAQYFRNQQKVDYKKSLENYAAVKNY